MATALKIILVFFVLIVAIIFLPKILALGFNFESGTGSAGTLSQPSNLKSGLISISYDGGETFKVAGVDSPGTPNILTINADASQKIFYAGTDQGILISKDNGLTWHNFVDLEKNIDAKTAVSDMAFNPNTGEIFLAAYKNNHGVVYVVNDNFLTVTPIWTEAKVKVVSLATDQNFLYVGLMDGRLLRFEYLTETFDKVYDFGSSVNNLILTNGGRDIYVTLANGEMSASQDFGHNWSTLKITSRSLSFSSGSGISLTPDLDNTAIIYHGSTSGVYRSIDKGKKWSALNTILAKNAIISSLAVQNGRVYIASGANLNRSADSGYNWRVGEPLPTSGKLGTLFVANEGQMVIVGVRK